VLKVSSQLDSHRSPVAIGSDQLISESSR